DFGLLVDTAINPVAETAARNARGQKDKIVNLTVISTDQLRKILREGLGDRCANLRLFGLQGHGWCYDLNGSCNGAGVQCGIHGRCCSTHDRSEERRVGK